MLIGTYTENSSSKGIYYYSLNQETGESKLLSTIMSENPSFITIHENKQNFYAVNEFNNGKQSLSSFLIQENSEIKKLNQVSTNFEEKSGADPCNILLFDKYILTSNYTGGSFTLFGIDLSNKTIKPNPIQYFSYSPKSHFHCAILSPDKKYIFITDLGADIIHRFSIGENTKSPLFDHKIAYEYKNKNQAGPRHMIFSNDGKFLYVLCELDDLLSVFSYNEGDIKHIETIKAYDGNGKGSADIHFSEDGSFLYTSHRLKNDGIAIFKVNKNEGTLEKKGFVETGLHPRNFNITPNGKFLICACRDSNVIQVFEINKENGYLINANKDINIDKPVCIKFL
jgi:6-phosphogluconolactonase (cycloisomerase 2 family)